MPNRIVIFLALPLILTLSSRLLAAEDPEVQNLRYISTLRVVVESLTPDARQAGITEEMVKGQIASFFKDSLPQITSNGDGPSLYLRIVLHKRKDEDLYYGMIGLSVDRPVMVLSSRGEFPAWSQVWGKNMVFSGKDPVMATFEIIFKLLSLLSEDFKKANP